MSNRPGFRRPAYRWLGLPIAFMMVLVLLASTAQKVSAADAPASTAVSANLGSTFVLSVGGFTPGEQVSLWTTNPLKVAMAAGSTYADNNGKIKVHIETIDPAGLATDANYWTGVSVTDSDGNVTDQYLRVILYQPTAGAWYLTAHGNTSNVSNILPFTITKNGVATVSSTPTAGALGTTFVMTGSKFIPNEQISLWTTDANNAVAAISEPIYADNSGSIKIRVETADPNGLATSSNYSSWVTLYDSDGNVTDQYLDVILHAPTAGMWHLTAQGNYSTITGIFSFTLNPPA